MTRVAATNSNLRPRHRPRFRVRPGAPVIRHAPVRTATIAHLPSPLRAPDSLAENTREARETMRFWVAQYLYPRPDGGARLVVRRIRAMDREAAESVALKGAPADEFSLTLVPESEAQFLGQVRHRALVAKTRRS